MAAQDTSDVPVAGQWPVPPQEDIPVSKDRIWVDGCFDFSHHGEKQCLSVLAPYSCSRECSLISLLLGHAGAMLQARRLGKELLVGVHSDEAILANKGPTVMTLKER